MSDNFEALQNQWKKNKKQVEHDSDAMSKMLASIKAKRNWSKRFHYGNIVVLSLVVVLISSFFYFVAPVQKILSQIGVALMVGGLLLRIGIEFFSVEKLKQIQFDDTVLKNTTDTLSFYAFRKQIHGPITIGIIALYTIGFFFITLEFTLYFSTIAMILIYVSYVIGAIVPVFFVRKNIIKEIRILKEITQLKDHISIA
ncbi:hypothetical protein [Aquimarina spongiae]|uniref:Uncharacterized protein n=1 Tax=Aquimarina spongiae TaxID=570521 RepID=A0A1M6CL67_9FLAO|nr:hypothetical protein [Aquimarina spongiae]SHI61756.1 hypothetical protein SAMN04488508_102170 [Aquimarina spongiae]